MSKSKILHISTINLHYDNDPYKQITAQISHIFLIERKKT